MSNPPLKTVEEHNADVLRRTRERDRTGCACPKCGEELRDASPGILLLTSPAQINVRCFGCGFTGRIYQ